MFAKSSHLAANVMIDRQTHRQTDRQTEWWGEKHNTFFQRYNDSISITMKIFSLMNLSNFVFHSFLPSYRNIYAACIWIITKFLPRLKAFIQFLTSWEHQNHNEQLVCDYVKWFCKPLDFCWKMKDMSIWHEVKIHKISDELLWQCYNLFDP